MLLGNAAQVAELPRTGMNRSAMGITVGVRTSKTSLEAGQHSVSIKLGTNLIKTECHPASKDALDAPAPLGRHPLRLYINKLWKIGGRIPCNGGTSVFVEHVH